MLNFTGNLIFCFLVFFNFLPLKMLKCAPKCWSEYKTNIQNSYLQKLFKSVTCRGCSKLFKNVQNCSELLPAEAVQSCEKLFKTVTCRVKHHEVVVGLEAEQQ